LIEHIASSEPVVAEECLNGGTERLLGAAQEPPGFAIQRALLLPRLPGSVQIIGAWPIPVDVLRVILYREVAVEPLVFGFHVILPEGIPVAVFS